MSQKAVLVRVEGNLIPEVFSHIPDYDEAVQICKNYGYEYKDFYSDYYMLEYEWIEIGDEESGTDEFIDDKILLLLYGFFDYEEKIYELFGLNVETVETGTIEVMLEDLKEE